MQKGQLQQWGQDMMSITLLSCFKLSVASVSVAGALAFFRNITGNLLQIVFQLVLYGLGVGIAIVIVAGIFKAITYGVGWLLVWLDDFLFYERPAKLTIRGKQDQLGENSEFYVKVKNRYWSSVDVQVSIHMQIQEGQNYILHTEHIKWSGVKSSNPLVSIKGCKTRLLHFASIHDGRFYIHLKSGSSMLVSPNPDGHIFSLTALAGGGKLRNPKEKDFDVVVSYGDDGRAKFKVKRVGRNEKRHLYQN